MKVVFLGLNDTGQKVLEYLETLKQDELYLFTQKNEIDSIHGIDPDIILSVGFRYIIPPEILALPPLGAINFHKSLLPLNRGANPVFWTILEGTKAGASIHYMDQGIDTGRIIAQREIETDLSDDAKTLYSKLDILQLELFKEVWPQIRKGAIKPVEQGGAPSYHVIKDFKKLRKIDPQSTVRAIDFINFLRAMTFPPFNNAYIEQNGKKYFVKIEITPEDRIRTNAKLKKTLLKQYRIENDD
ncbi:hypothetical protein D1BOALGB6SA_2542 [Olavius sp. associated proteobacterium Delta 1]|nr:hypothetical protein D1BOALGB6SA_2542 [Olavius sp. associated proteobacterium Delta 1]